MVYSKKMKLLWSILKEFRRNYVESKKCYLCYRERPEHMAKIVKRFLLICERNSRTVPFEYWALLEVFTNVLASVKLSNVVCRICFLKLDVPISSLIFLCFLKNKISFTLQVTAWLACCVELLFFSTQNSEEKSTRNFSGGA